MASINRTMILSLFITSLLISLIGISTAVNNVHIVGDDAGWIIRDDTYYAKWASSNNFQVGDTLLFGYNKNYHNVLQVNRGDFESCNTNSPIAIYSSGSDSVTLKRPGHYYYLCGAPGHCQAGQKLEVAVSDLISSSTAPTTPPTPTLNLAPTPTPTPVPGPTPIPSAAKTTSTSGHASASSPVLFFSMVVVATVLIF